MCGQVFGDTLQTRDGARLTGTVKGIANGIITLDTPYAGVIEVKQSEVVSIQTEGDVFVRLESGSTMRGRVSGGGSGGIQVTGTDGVLTTSVDKVVSTWGPAEVDPAIKAERAEAEKLRKAADRKWSYTAGIAVEGSSGNTEAFGANANFRATLKSKKDELVFYGSYTWEENEGVATEDEVIGGLRYTNFFYNDLGWYTRGELERDEFEDLDLRTTAGAGLSYRFFDTDTSELSVRAGFSYRYESFSTQEDVGDPGMDFGLSHYWKFAEWGEISNELSYVPSFGDFGDYRFVQDSGVNIPLGASDLWQLRFGLQNDYNSAPAPGNEELDTTYYSRLQLKWD